MNGLTIDWELHIDYYNSVQRALRMVLLMSDFQIIDVSPLPGVDEILVQSLQDAYTILLQKAIEVEINSGSSYPDLEGIDILIQEDYILDIFRPEGLYNPGWGLEGLFIYKKIILIYRHKQTTQPQPEPDPSDPYSPTAKSHPAGGSIWCPDPNMITSASQWEALYVENPWTFPDGLSWLTEMHPQFLGAIFAQLQSTLEYFDPDVPQNPTVRAFKNEISTYLSRGDTISPSMSFWEETWRVTSKAEADALSQALHAGVSFLGSLYHRPDFWYGCLSDTTSVSWGYSTPDYWSFQIQGKPIPPDFDYIYIPGEPRPGNFTPWFVPGLIILGLLGQFAIVAVRVFALFINGEQLVINGEDFEVEK